MTFKQRLLFYWIKLKVSLHYWRFEWSHFLTDGRNYRRNKTIRDKLALNMTMPVRVIDSTKEDKATKKAFEAFKELNKDKIEAWFKTHKEQPPIFRDPITGEFVWANRYQRKGLEKQLKKRHQLVKERLNNSGRNRVDS